MIIPRKGTPLVISAPSGAGKTTLCHRVIRRISGIVYSVSHTTRPRRGKEVEGQDYHFVDDQAFDRLVHDNAFLEWAHVHGRRYGTSRFEAEKHLKAGSDVLFDIDVQGGNQVAAAMQDAVLILILPPSMTVLSERLRSRQTETQGQIKARLEAAAIEIAQAIHYTHFIINDNLDEATLALESIVRAERLKRYQKDELIARVLGRQNR